MPYKKIIDDLKKHFVYVTFQQIPRSDKKKHIQWIPWHPCYAMTSWWKSYLSMHMFHPIPR